MNLSKNCKISTAITPTAGAAGTSTINGTTLDMQDSEGVLMIVRMGAITAGAVTSIKVQQGDASNLGDAADLAGTGQTIADTDDDKTFYIDLYKPLKRYVRVVVSRATQNAVVASAEYIQYKSRKMPVTHGSGVSGETHISPAEGTA
jgi:hypothetical protein